MGKTVSKLVWRGHRMYLVIFCCSILLSSSVVCSQDVCAEFDDPCEIEDGDSSCCSPGKCTFVVDGYYACVDPGEQDQECQFYHQLCGGYGDYAYGDCCEGLHCDCFGRCQLV